jgi:glyoxylase-like metal-dependent hydrolase (beta-lactamase superfamily II)
MSNPIAPVVVPFFDPMTATASYLVRDPTSRHCAIVDPVADFDPETGRISHGSADRIIDAVRQSGLELDWLIETHAHADHLTAAHYLKSRLGGAIAIGENIRIVQEAFADLLEEGGDFPRDGSQFDRLLRDGDTYAIGAVQATVMATPGHTPACMTHVIGDAVFVGDALFMPDVGTGRTDFPGSDARELYRSVRRILALPAGMRVFVGHDYAPGGRETRVETTIAEERRGNIHARDGVGEEAFVALRRARDETLDPPRLMVPSIQANIRAGALPRASASGTHFLRLPVKLP